MIESVRGPRASVRTTLYYCMKILNWIPKRDREPFFTNNKGDSNSLQRPKNEDYGLKSVI